MRKFLKFVGLIVAVLVLLIVVGLGWLFYDGRRAREANPEYVALGSSFAAGPGAVEKSAEAPGLCGQSAYNYAHLLAKRRNLRLLDRSCGGSTTAHILHDQQFFQSPQIEAVGPSARLVTITTGGNDLGYVGGLFGASCKQRPSALPWWLKSACKAKPADLSAGKIQALTQSMDQVAKEVRRRAPKATLAFVDYTEILPATGECPDRLPLSAEDLAHARAAAKTLAGVTEQIARSNGAILIRASALSRGHGVCGKEPWVFGWAFPDRFLGFGPMAYHPNGRAMQAIAAALDKTLPR